MTSVPGAKVVRDSRHHASLKKPKKDTNRHETAKVGDEGGSEAYDAESDDETRYYHRGCRISRFREESEGNYMILTPEGSTEALEHQVGLQPSESDYGRLGAEMVDHSQELH